jgi:hypothetical protein
VLASNSFADLYLDGELHWEVKNKQMNATIKHELVKMMKTANPSNMLVINTAL